MLLPCSIIHKLLSKLLLLLPFYFIQKLLAWSKLLRSQTVAAMLLHSSFSFFPPLCKFFQRQYLYANTETHFCYCFQRKFKNVFSLKLSPSDLCGVNNRVHKPGIVSSRFPCDILPQNSNFMVLMTVTGSSYKEIIPLPAHFLRLK